MEHEYEIPREIHEWVLDLLCSIVNASSADDQVMVEIFTNQLLDFCGEQTAAGHGSGFLWEAAGDVTDDPGERKLLYQRALTYAVVNGEPTHTLFCELGELAAEEGEVETARDHFERARQQAILRHDLDTEGRAAASLLQLENTHDQDGR